MGHLSGGLITVENIAASCNYGKKTQYDTDHTVHYNSTNLQRIRGWKNYAFGSAVKVYEHC